MSKLTCSAAWLCAILVASGSTHVGARNAPLFDAAIDVRLIEVTVTATDRDGSVITDLDEDDFELLIDGAPVTISHFQRPRHRTNTEIQEGTEEPQPLRAETAVAIRDRLNLVVYLDRAFLRPGEGAGLVAEVEHLMSDLLEPGDRVMLWVADHRLDLVRTLTSDHQSLGPLLEAEIAKPGRGRAFETEYRDVLAEMERTIEEGFDIDARDPARTADRLRSRVETVSGEALFEVQRSTELLERAIVTTRGLRGRTAMVYYGGRLPIAAGVALASAWKQTFNTGAWRFQDRNADTAGTSSGASSTDGLSGFDRQPSVSGSFEAAQLLTNVGKLAASSNITFFVGDRSQLRRSTAEALSNEGQTLESIGSGNWSLDSTQETPSREALRSAAVATGGKLLGGNASTVTREWYESSYVLGFELPFEDSDTDYQLELRVPERPRLELAHRHTIRAVDADSAIAEHVLATLRLGAENLKLGNSHQLEVTIAPARKPDHLRISVRLPLASIALVADQQNHRGQLSLFWAAATTDDPEHREPSVGKSVLPVSIANRDLLTSLSRQVEYAFEVASPTSRGVLAITVRDDFSSEYSTARLPLEATDSH